MMQEKNVPAHSVWERIFVSINTKSTFKEELLVMAVGAGC